MRQAVRDVPGMEVVDDDRALDLLLRQVPRCGSDLVAATDALRQNRIVRHLVESS